MPINRTIITALIGFMPSKGEGAIGALDYPASERKALALKSKDWICPRCGSNNATALPDEDMNSPLNLPPTTTTSTTTTSTTITSITNNTTISAPQKEENNENSNKSVPQSISPISTPSQTEPKSPTITNSVHTPSYLQKQEITPIQKPTSQPIVKSVEEEVSRVAIIENFSLLTGISKKEAKQLLEKAKWNFDEAAKEWAVQKYFDI